MEKQVRRIGQTFDLEKNVVTSRVLRAAGHSSLREYRSEQRVKLGRSKEAAPWHSFTGSADSFHLVFTTVHRPVFFLA